MSLHVQYAITSLSGATRWLNCENGLDDLQCKPLLIYFWAISCPLCHVNMPQLQELRDNYTPRGLHVIAVHRPRGEDDLDTDKVNVIAKILGITEPCAIDNEHCVGDDLGVSDWPTYYLFDSNGKLLRRAVGNFGVKVMEDALENLYDVVKNSPYAVYG